MREHYHNGVVGRQIDTMNITGIFKTITAAADLTVKLTTKPSRFIDQIFIDTSTGTKKLYAFDTIGQVWRSVTIA